MLKKSALLACVVLGLSFTGASADDKQVCFSTGSDAYKQEEYIAQGLAACTREINSGRHSGTDLAYYYRARGYWYNRKNDFNASLQDFNRSADLDPNHAETYDYRADLYVKMGNEERALADFEQSIRLKPEYAAPYYSRGEVYRRRGETERAIAEYRKAISLPTINRIAEWAQTNAKQRLQELEGSRGNTPGGTNTPNGNNNPGRSNNPGGANTPGGNSNPGTGSTMDNNTKRYD